MSWRNLAGEREVVREAMTSMGGSGMRQWIRGVKRILAGSMNLLNQREAGCLLCGKSIVNAAGRRFHSGRIRDIETLCRDCSASVPWITAVKCAVCGRAEACGDCARRASTLFACNRSAVRYDPFMKRMLALYKYRGHERLEPALVDMLSAAYEALTDEVLAKSERPRSVRKHPWDGVTYVPVSEERAAERGFNQAERLAAGLARRYGLPLAPLLVRTKHGAKQSFKTRAQRIRDMRHVFDADEEGMAKLRLKLNMDGGAEGRGGRALQLLLVDDIYTTGSTAQACARILTGRLGAGTVVYVLTWARS